MFQATTELVEGGKYTFRLTDEGKLFVTPQTARSAVRLCKFASFIEPADNPEAYMAYLASPTEIELEDKKGWVFAEYEVPKAYTEPYLKRYDDWFGGKPKGGLISFLRDPLIYTRISYDAVYDPDTETFKIKGFACQYNSYEPDEARSGWQDHWNEALGHRKSEREYIGNGFGTYSLNPNYLKRYKAQPGWDYNSFRTDVAKAVWYSWQDRWKETASPAQLDLLNNINMTFGKPPRVRLEDSTIYVTDPLGKCNYDGKGKMVQVYNAKEFKAKLAYFTGG
jgi:hypothetical protein